MKNESEQVIYQVRSQLEEHGDKVSPEARSNIESSLSNLEAKLKEDDREAIQAALKQLNDNAMELGKAVYEASAAQNEAGAESGDDDGVSAGDDDVIDAEYEVKDES
jgi:molecular chaperone DnaK